MTPEFVSEDDLECFEGWLKYQAPGEATPEELVRLRALYERDREISLASPKVGLMNHRPSPGEHCYAVAVRNASDLWLTLWVKRNPKGEFFVFQPRSDTDLNAHTSYHEDGTLHWKIFDHKALPPSKRQPLTGTFRGVEHLGMYKGHGPKCIGAICDPKAFSGVVEAVPGVLGLVNGGVLVDLVEPDHAPVSYEFGETVQQEIFRNIEPWVVIRVVRD